VIPARCLLVSKTQPYVPCPRTLSIVNLVWNVDSKLPSDSGSCILPAAVDKSQSGSETSSSVIVLFRDEDHDNEIKTTKKQKFAT
ncbi:hypothetical protein PENTCL1PPCAC_30525, partial [Pristionchus entomophagus]